MGQLMEYESGYGPYGQPGDKLSGPKGDHVQAGHCQLDKGEDPERSERQYPAEDGRGSEGLPGGPSRSPPVYLYIARRQTPCAHYQHLPALRTPSEAAMPVAQAAAPFVTLVPA